MFLGCEPSRRRSAREPPAEPTCSRGRTCCPAGGSAGASCLIPSRSSASPAPRVLTENEERVTGWRDSQPQHSNPVADLQVPHPPGSCSPAGADFPQWGALRTLWVVKAPGPPPSLQRRTCLSDPHPRSVSATAYRAAKMPRSPAGRPPRPREDGPAPGAPRGLPGV